MIMEKKNPLENIRSAILGSQLFGIENEISCLGVSDELMKISDALDSYYGIVRERKEEPSNEDGLIRVMNEYYKTHPNSSLESIFSRSSNSRYSETSFNKELSLLSRVKAPLLNMKQKLSKDHSLYLDISTTIASIAFNSVVSNINSYKKTPKSPYEPYESDLFSSMTGIDHDYYQLITNGTKVFRKLNGFDMDAEFRNNYEDNRKALFSLSNKINEIILKPKTTSSSRKSSSSGCMALALAVSASMISCLGVIILFLV